MAAAVATLTTLRDTGAIAHMTAMGTRLRAGLAAGAATYGMAIRQTGPVQMPMVLFDDDDKLEKAFAFCSAALRHGAYFHPRHNMFLSAAHRPVDIDRALAAADAGFDAVRRLAR
jgi:glutamate-1-semialdehyde 2,1-aminomutase